MNISNIFENRAERVARLTASLPPDALKQHSKALGAFTDGVISLSELLEALYLAPAPEPTSAPAQPVAWQGSEEDAQRWRVQRWRETQ